MRFNEKWTVCYLNVLIFLLLFFFAALALLLCLLQPFDKRSSLGMDLFGKFLRDVLLRNLVDENKDKLIRLRLNTDDRVSSTQKWR